MELVNNALTPAMYNALRESVGWSAFSAAQVQKALQQDARNVVAYVDQKPVAMGRIIGDGIYFLLVDVVVAPKYQGKGIGKDIIESLMQSVKSGLASDERCSIQLVSAQGKEAFYEKMGFSSIPNQKSGHGMQLLIKA